MKGTRPIWLGFALSVAIVWAATGWLSLTVFKLGRAQAEAHRQSLREQRLRLALWRMESALAPLVAEENARPYYHYASSYPITYEQEGDAAEPERKDLLVPSPLATFFSPFVRLHFQLSPDGALSSPQVADGGRARTGLGAEGRPPRASALAEFERIVGSREELLSLLSQTEGAARERSPTSEDFPTTREDGHGHETAAFASVWDHEARLNNMLQAFRLRRPVGLAHDDDEPVREHTIRPLWVNGALVLARRVSFDDEDYVQGCWLNWETIRPWLRSLVLDLLPEADVGPAAGGPGASTDPPTLAALPVTLKPGAISTGPAVDTRAAVASIVLVCVCVLVASAMAGLMLRTTFTLTRRRVAFACAVSHELRTPLTTFVLYSGMLADGVVVEPRARHAYLGRLHAEAKRMQLLVENVLAYAAPESRKTPPVRSLTLRELLKEVAPHLSGRAKEGGMSLAVKAAEPVLRTTVRTNKTAVSRILMNLVDNACKYASSSSTRVIDLEAGLEDSAVILRVRDYGPGVSKAEARHAFHPFSTGKNGNLPRSTTSVGLGLALSRRIAEGVGAELYLDTRVKNGACFAVRLPATVATEDATVADARSNGDAEGAFGMVREGSGRRAATW
jgi:signal transduction histidine kinase